MEKFYKIWLCDCNPSIFISCSYWIWLEFQEFYQSHMQHMYFRRLLSGKFSVLRMNLFTNGVWAVTSLLTVSASRPILCSYTQLPKFWAVVWLLLSSAISSEVIPQRLPLHLDTTVLSEPRCYDTVCLLKLTSRQFLLCSSRNWCHFREDLCSQHAQMCPSVTSNKLNPLDWFISISIWQYFLLHLKSSFWWLWWILSFAIWHHLAWYTFTEGHAVA
jgi:hypothetical protein